jgi:hypothetical protein
MCHQREWSERTQRYQRALIREHCGFRAFRARDESSLIAWVSERVTSPDPEMEALKIAAYDHLRSQHVEPPETERLLRLLRMAVGRCEERIVTEVVAQLSPATRVALDEIVITQASDDSDQLPLFPVRSELAAIKDGTGAVKGEHFKTGLRSLPLSFRILFGLHSRIPANKGLPELVIEHLCPYLE